MSDEAKQVKLYFASNLTSVHDVVILIFDRFIYILKNILMCLLHNLPVCNISHPTSLP